MKLIRVSVEKLFGTFNDAVGLNTSDGITIIYGPNGIGKTALLKLINSFFSADFVALRTIPFGKLQLDLSDNSCIEVYQVPKHESRAQSQSRHAFGTDTTVKFSFRIGKGKSHE